ncbi:hypothetical protein DCAR_0418218 [Daucus carota subsp. sativus]|uniref:Uncharacterized protein n=1 Tax=Daucus carota subsp. sativus TaxID=79200 RepID=A0A165Z8Q7_DAUCS|nr:PREDICTED: VQ motif-containing protein 9-like [Daucus carota subsp. sativus]WOG98872.1 hypothetical protein DCAR_0418218 [Daucus carota subsp. sativus]
MEKASLTATESSSTTTTGNNNNSSGKRDRDQFLKHVNKLSHKISKPKKTTMFDNNYNSATLNEMIEEKGVERSQPLVQPLVMSQTQSQPLNLHQPQQQHQPPVYNINKSDFRDVVQQLTGSPAHERFNTPPPIQAPKPTSSRLQKIRPPPLPQINAPPPMNPSFLRQPLSPLPPFPSVHTAAESPISAYMRYIQNANFPSPRWNNFAAPPLPPENIAPASSIQFPTPSSSYGCIPSPKSPYPSPLGFPLSPSVSSPRWKGN